ncbi:MAG: hypothetical protein R3338_04810, partial [Thermoanaerobaculia bacterium]|nr:hypothetical protein [Thermoanaerobaculia bacterium]
MNEYGDETGADDPVERSGIRWRMLPWAGAGLVLLVPLVAMQFSDEVHWDLSDFIFAGVLIGGSGIAYEITARRRQDIQYRAAVAIALAGMFILIWANA